MSQVFQFRVRVAMVLIRNNQLLLVRQNNRPFWVLPGGTLELGESMADCVVRELKEEVNLDVAVEQLLYVADFIQDPAKGKQVIDVVFLGNCLGGEVEMTLDENLNEVKWTSLDELNQLAQANLLKPTVVFKAIQSAWQGKNFNFNIDTLTTYLGSYGLD